MKSGRLSVILLAAAALAAPSYGQMAISAKAGLVNAADGDVFIDGKLVEPKANEFVTAPKGGEVRTGEGRVEVLLTPGAFLRMAETGAFRLVENDLSNVVVDLLEGSVLIDIAELADETGVTVRVAGHVVRPKKRGIYLIEAGSEPRIRVYNGEAAVAANDQEFVLKGGREFLAGNVQKFDTEETNALFRWAARRSEYIAMANLSAARSASAGTATGTGMMGRWIYNPFFGAMTYVPWGSNVFSPFGFAFFNPFNVYRVYMPPAFGRGPDPWGGGAGGGFNRGQYGGVAAMSGSGPRMGGGGFENSSRGMAGGAGGARGMSPAPSAGMDGGGVRGGASGGGRLGSGGGRQ